MQANVECYSLSDLDNCAGKDTAAIKQLNRQIESVFFSSSNRRSFGSPAERDAFRQLWLGQFLERDRSHAFAAIDQSCDRGTMPAVVGYLVGCLEHPVGNERFAALEYFDRFSAYCDDYPAQLHVNVDAAYRGVGIGGRLVALFADHVAAHGINGMHVVTNPDSRNVRFYRRCGFEEKARCFWRGSNVVFLGRNLQAPARLFADK